MKNEDLLKLDPVLFIKHILDYKVEDFHKAWLIQTIEQKKDLLLAPRGHGKSTIRTVGYILWRVCNNANLRVLIVSNTDNQVVGFLREIRDNLTSNPKLNALFSAILPRKQDKVTESEVIFNRSKFYKEPTIGTCGVGSSYPIGKHWDIIICDDVVDNTNTATKDQIEKLEHWFNKVLMPTLEPEGEIHVTGTRWHYNDLYNGLIEKDWYLQKYKVYKDDGSPLWPSYFNDERIAERRKEIGSEAFASQYLNDPIDLENATFKREWIKFYDDLPDNFYNYFVAIDPAFTAKNKDRPKADSSGIVVVAVNARNDMYVIKTIRAKVSAMELMDMIFDLNKAYNPQSIGIESGSTQKAMVEFVIEEMKRRNDYIPLIALQPDNDKSKQDRIRMLLAPRFQYGNIYLKEDMTDLIDQVIRFPKIKHEDLIDSLAYVTKICFTADAEKSTSVKSVHPFTNLVNIFKEQTASNNKSEDFGYAYQDFDYA